MKQSKFDKEYKAIISDIDGTLTNKISNANLSPLPSIEVINSIKLSHNKVKFVLATSRSLLLTNYLIEALSITGPVIIHNGATIINATTKEVFWEKQISKKDLFKVIKYLNKNKLDFIIDEREKVGIKFTEKYKPNNPLNIYLTELDDDELKMVEKDLGKIPSINLHRTNSVKVPSKWGVNITNSEVSKQHAILEVAKILDITPDEMIGVGDGYNDFPLLMACGLRVAMGNGVPEIKAIANYIAPPLEEDGIVDVIKKFVLKEKTDYSSLTAISPIDGRYKNQTEELSEYSSEYAVIKYRTKIEIKYLIALSKINVIRKLKLEEQRIIENVIENFDLIEAEKIKEIERETKHDVKAIEYYLKQKLSDTSLFDVLEFIHFGLTSEDIDNLANRLMLKDGLEKVVIPSLEKLNNEIFDKSKRYRKLPIIARTHGQSAVPTTFGKELLVFYERLNKEIEILKGYKLNGKLNGAVGNYNALYFTYPKINWQKFSKEFIESFELKPIFATTQINPYDDTIYVFQTIERINNILIGFNQDVWRYISDHWFIQENKKGEIGSSTMPQKINPIMFENSEGNLIISNSLIHGFTNKLLISRLQRDLSSSTIMRNFGLTLAHSLLAYKSCQSGLLRLKVNEQKIKEDLNSDWSILSEAVQIYLKKEGIKNGYEIIKNETRGQKMTQKDFTNMIEKLPLNSKQKTELKKLTPENYIGIIN